MRSILDHPCLSPEALAEATGLVCTYHPLVLAPYQETEGHWAIGWGSHCTPDGQAVTADSAPIGPRAADEMLRRTLLRIGERVLQVVTVSLTDAQAGSLTALVYDISNVSGNTLTVSGATTGLSVGSGIQAVNPAPWATYPKTMQADQQHYTPLGYEIHGATIAQYLIDNVFLA